MGYKNLFFVLVEFGCTIDSEILVLMDIGLYVDFVVTTEVKH